MEVERRPVPSLGRLEDVFDLPEGIDAPHQNCCWVKEAKVAPGVNNLVPCIEVEVAVEGDWVLCAKRE